MNHSTKRVPPDWRGRLPVPEIYFEASLGTLSRRREQDGCRIGACPFHAGGDRSLEVDVVGLRGRWRCGICGARGDLVAFVMKLDSVPFPIAVRTLLDFAKAHAPKPATPKQRRMVAGLRRNLGIDDRSHKS